MQNKLISIINSYSSDGFYKGSNIPPQKLQAATQYYPVDPHDTPLALIDTTVFGSAKTGMVIGLKGLYFRNDGSTKTEQNYISWETLSNNHTLVGKGSMFCILLIQGCEFNMSGGSMKRELLINLLNQIIVLYGEIKEVIDTQGNTHQVDDNTDSTHNNRLIESQPSNETIYIEIVPEIIALCLVADGEIEESEIELACAIIENDEFIYDKHAALESLTCNIEKFTAEKEKSNTIFKLKTTTILSKLKKLTDQQQKDRLIIMLEGLLEAVGDSGVDSTKSMVDSVLKNL